MVLDVIAHAPHEYAVVGLAQGLNVLVVQNILSALRADVLKRLAVAVNAIETVLACNRGKESNYISHAAILRAKRLSTLAAIEATAVVVLPTHLDNFTTQLRVAQVAVPIYRR